MFPRLVLLLGLVACTVCNEKTGEDSRSSRTKRAVDFHTILTSLSEHIQQHGKFKEEVGLNLTVIKNQSNELKKLVLQNDVKMDEKVSKVESDVLEVDKKVTSLRKLFDRLLCPPGFEYVYAIHSCYKIVEEAVDWETAKQTCNQDNGSHLVTIETEEEMQVLKQKVSSYSTNFWTGGNDRVHEGVWKWEHSGRNLSYTNWAPGYPILLSVDDSSLLTAQHLSHIQQWLPNKRLSLLYRSTRDGMNGPAFHAKCDHKGPTISVGLDAVSNTLYGGYTTKDWPTSGYVSDAEAFVFRVCLNHCTTVKFDVSNADGGNAIFGSSSYGPDFGSPDIIMFKSPVTYDTTNQYFASDGYCATSVNYYTGTLNCGKNIKWKDVEVFGVQDAPDSVDCMALRPGDQKWEDKECSEKQGFICEV